MAARDTDQLVSIGMTQLNPGREPESGRSTETRSMVQCPERMGFGTGSRLFGMGVQIRNRHEVDMICRNHSASRTA